MEQPTVIPTAWKHKIPHSLSYPIGSEAISQALIGVPQFDELSLDFTFWRRLARNPEAVAPFGILDAGYSGTDAIYPAEDGPQVDD